MYIDKESVFQEIFQITNTPEFLISNSNFKINPFFIVIGNKKKLYYVLNVSFMFVSEVPKSIESYEEVVSARKEKKQNKEFIEAHDLFVKTINDSIDQIIRKKQNEIAFKMEFYITPEKKYRSIVSFQKISGNNFIRINFNSVPTGDKYRNKIETAIQCAGDAGITTTELIKKTQLLEKHERQGILDYLLANKIITLKQEKSGPKTKNTYFWNNDHE